MNRDFIWVIIVFVLLASLIGFCRAVTDPPTYGPPVPFPEYWEEEK